jgi:acetylglutamate kinase
MPPVKPIVVKIGGSTLGGRDTTFLDLIALQARGVPAVVVHGGGSKVTRWLEQMGVPTTFVRGMRVTDEATLEVVIAVLAGLVNKEIVAAITRLGGRAIGLSGVDGGIIQARVKDPQLGYVGETVRIDPEPIYLLLNAGYIPVIATGGMNVSGEGGDKVDFLNLNGDASASEIAVAIDAGRLIFMTDVPGVRDGTGNTIPRISRAEAGALIESGVVSGGMIPKVEGCLRALSRVEHTQIIDGRSAGVLVAAVEGQDIGTRID